MAPSFIFKNRGNSYNGRPKIVRNTWAGKGPENCAEKSISSSPMNLSIRSFTNCVVEASINLIRWGEKRKSRIFRYLRWSGGSTCNRSEEHTSELQSLRHLVCRLLL